MKSNWPICYYLTTSDYLDVVLEMAAVRKYQFFSLKAKQINM